MFYHIRFQFGKKPFALPSVKKLALMSNLSIAVKISYAINL